MYLLEGALFPGAEFAHLDVPRYEQDTKRQVKKKTKTKKTRDTNKDKKTKTTRRRQNKKAITRQKKTSRKRQEIRDRDRQTDWQDGQRPENKRDEDRRARKDRTG
jgi:hypothetical protein